MQAATQLARKRAVVKCIKAGSYVNAIYGSRPFATMSLVTGYSSDEDNGPSSPTGDAFGLAKLPTAKKPRVEDVASGIVVTAAPDVLSEVRNCTTIF